MATFSDAPQLDGYASPPTISALAGSSDATRFAAVGVIFVVSVIAAGFPTAAQRIQAIRIPSLLFFIGKHFGTGVILSTAFIHLLSDAFTNLRSLRTFGYKNWPGAILLGSLLVIFLVEYTSTVYVESVAARREASDKAPPCPTSHPPPSIANGNSIIVAAIHESPVPTYPHLPDVERPSIDHPELSRSGRSHPRRPSSSLDGHPNERSPLMGRRRSSAMRDAYFDVYMHHHDHAHSEGHCPENDEERKDKAIQLLGVCLFEGLSLGVRLASLPSHLPPFTATGPSSGSRNISIRFVPHTLALLFGITTPVGILVGLLIQKIMHADFTNPEPPANDSLMSTPSGRIAIGGTTFRGVMAAVSAGLLIYAGCVELLAGDFVMDADLRKSPRGRQILAVVSLFAGAFGMALIN
ncbi:hypothetical protein FS837_002960 [Tulasnella sp. UAMH 9824]|nr:hypothetical protein FS837_002960 [Tulasnella sp. UAMH 9824]